MQATDRKWLTVREFANTAGVSQTFVYDSVRDGNLPAIKVRGKILIASDAFERLLDEQLMKQHDQQETSAKCG
jgi:excisionase family DNA binding protein